MYEVAQRIEIGRIELVGREETSEAIGPEIDRCLVEIPISEKAIRNRAADRLVSGKLRCLVPEAIECDAGARSPTVKMTLDQSTGVHRAGACAADAFDLEAIVLEETIEHAPGESTVSAATLERKIDLFP